MKLLTRIVTSAFVMLAPMTAQALDVGEDDIKWVSELADAGFQPFPVSSAANASFGMIQDSTIYLCFLADTQEYQSIRREKLIGLMQDGGAGKAVPNIAVACVLAQ